MVDNCMAGYNSCMFAYGQVRLLSHPDHIYAELMKAKTSKNISELQNRFLNSCVLLGRFQGFHCFDFVQTGSGKTHTMLGDMEHFDQQPNENRGMTPRVFEYLFAKIQKVHVLLTLSSHL